VGPCLAVVNLDAVCHGIGGDEMDVLPGSPGGLGVRRLLANRWGSRSGLAGLP
jgi:hypothetical protein